MVVVSSGALAQDTALAVAHILHTRMMEGQRKKLWHRAGNIPTPVERFAPTVEPDIPDRMAGNLADTMVDSMASGSTAGNTSDSGSMVDNTMSADLCYSMN